MDKWQFCLDDRMKDEVNEYMILDGLSTVLLRLTVNVYHGQGGGGDKCSYMIMTFGKTFSC